MIVSLWRLAHLGLALVSSLFLLILSVTGVILAVGAINEKTQGHKAPDFENLRLSAVIPILWEEYPEISTLNVDHNGFVSLEATDADGNPVHAYIDPASGRVLGDVKPQSDFIQWNIALHRSLFLKETGRIVVGLVSFLLLLITFTGILLIAKRQQGLRNFFARVNRDSFAQYFHVVTGRLFLVPVLLLALTGTYLFMVRIGLIEGTEEHSVLEDTPAETFKKPAEFPVFRQTLLKEVEKIEFPFLPDDPEEYYVVKLRDRERTVHQLNGTVAEEIRYPYSLVLEKLSLDLHTGRTNALWALVLGFASLNILFFMYTGFAISLKRKQTRVRNRYRADKAEYILLAGTENGTTLAFANKIHEQLLAHGYISYLTEMNRLTAFPEARHLLIFTSTYGLGTAPANAGDFERRLPHFSPKQPFRYSVVGFGSRSYADFCAFAHRTDQLLEALPQAQRLLPLHSVNDRSAEDFTAWVKAWNRETGGELGTTPALYATQVTGLKKFEVIEKTEAEHGTFRIRFLPLSKQAFRSGDLLAVYPAGDARERLYSIGKNDGTVQLMVKRLPGGLGSGFLYGLEPGSRISARLVRNASFHFPAKAPAVVMIANGTGIAPFLGMVAENRQRVPITLYAGFRHNNALAHQYRQFAEEQQAAKRLEAVHFAFSREENPQYVMDLIRRDTLFFIGHLRKKGAIMLCGSLAMQRDVTSVLAGICEKAGLDYPTDRILSDCY